MACVIKYKGKEYTQEEFNDFLNANKESLLREFLSRPNAELYMNTPNIASANVYGIAPIQSAQEQYDAGMTHWQQAKEHTKNIQNKIKDVFRPLLSGKFSDKEKDLQIEGARILMNTLATTWGKLHGLPKEYYYERYEDVRQSNVGDLTGDTLFQVLGEQRVENLIDSVEKLNDLKTAKQRHRQGVPMGVIKRLTGWELHDGKWKTEIDDSWNFNTDLNLNKAGLVNLVDLIKGDAADRLFEAYPNLKGFQVEIENSKDAFKGAYDRDNQKIILNRRYLRTQDALKSTLIHEVMHHGQVEEGWQQGSSLEQIKKDIENNVNVDIYKKNILSNFKKFSKDVGIENVNCE